MIHPSENPISKSSKFNRSTIIALLQAANKVGSTRFAREVSELWLAEFSGDLSIELSLAQALLQDDRQEQAIAILKKISFIDPEYLPAQRILAQLGNQLTYTSKATAIECITALGGSYKAPNFTPKWGAILREAISHSQDSHDQKAEELFAQVLTLEIDSPLPAIMHLKFSRDHYPLETSVEIGEKYVHRWPDALSCLLIHADALMQTEQESSAVTFLHHAVSLDVGGQAAYRLWNSQHPYLELWPKDPAIYLEIPIPANVASVMGWNQLLPGEINKPINEKNEPIIAEAPLSSPDGRRDSRFSKMIINATKSEFEHLAAKIKNPVLGSAEALFPVYVLLTTKEGLENHYGLNNLKVIDDSLSAVALTTQALGGWGSYVVYADDPHCAEKFHLPPAKYNDPWSIKTFIQDLDESLSKRGEMIGALLIVGNEKVVPFHLLPNPVDDFDTEVPSDNPYSSKDENYYVSTWPTGRLPGSSSKDPSPLLHQLAQIVKSRNNEEHPKKAQPILISFLKYLATRFFTKPPSFSLGCTAQVWRRAAHAVFRPIGKPDNLRISPPANASQISPKNSSNSHLAYYNLHGLEDTPEWYGQRDPIEYQNGPDYPIALRPQDIQNSGKAPKIVFSEACFGSNIISKNVEEAICLKFLASGTKAVVGSTCTSYGSITTPLVAADLLGKAFWSFIQEGFPAGEALSRAKIHLANDMNKRQGYLDGEDQKTLISFILYGDPLARLIGPIQNTNSKNYLRTSYKGNNLKAVCDKNDHITNPIPPEVMAQVKGVVKNYLPGMLNASLSYSSEHIECHGHVCPIPKHDPKNVPDHSPSRNVVTLSKQVTKDNITHSQHARITFNADGKIEKLAVSR